MGASIAAAAPLLAVLVLMVGFRWRAAAAGAVGLVLAAIAASTLFGFGTQRASELGLAGALAGAALEAAFTTATILWIVFPALALYELQSRSGQLEVLRQAIGRLSARPRTQVLFIAWFFALFLEGASGFGAPVALAAPFLVMLGHPPIRAVVLALVGHAAGVSFGALGTPVVAQAALLPLSPDEIAQATAMLHLAAGWILLCALVWLSAPERPTVQDWRDAVLAGGAFYLPFTALAIFAGAELPTIGAAALGAAAFALLQRRSRQVDGPSRASLLRAGAPYFVLMGLVVVTRTLPPVRDGLQSVEIAWRLGETFGGSFRPLFHTGTLLVLSVIAGAWLQRRSVLELQEAALCALRKLGGVAAALFVMLALSRIMMHGGLMAELAAGAAATGALWPLLAPSLGALGSFVTGSATASNILLTPFQSAAAAELSLPGARMAAAQGFGAAMGNIICPHNVIAGAAAVGLKGQDGDILRRTAPVCAAALLVAGLVLLVWT